MVNRQQEEIALRYATEEQRKRHYELLGKINDMFSKEIRENIETRDKAIAAGMSEEEARAEVVRLIDKQTYYDNHRRLMSYSQELSELDDAIRETYIAEVQKDKALLFADIEEILTTAFTGLHNTPLPDIYMQDVIIEQFNNLKVAGKQPTFRKASKAYVIEWIEPQQQAYKQCKDKTAEDKEKYKSIIDTYTNELLDMLTPEMRKGIEQRFNSDRVEHITPIRHADTFYTPNSYVAGNFMDILKGFYKDNDGQMSFIPQNMEIDITGKGKGYIPVMLSINYEGDITKEGTKSIDYNRARIEGFDTNVLDAICTILETGQNDIYVSAVDALLRGSDKIQKVSEKREERIILAFRKLGGTRVRLDITNELKGKYDFAALDLKEGIMDAAMLEYTGLELTTYAGKKTYVIHVDKMPAIYQYSKAKGEITSFPTALLDTPERAEERFTTLKIALLKRITLINKRIMNSKTILFNTLYSTAGLEEIADKGNRSKERDKLIDMLKVWKEQGYIKGYKPHYEGRAYTGFEIEPHYINTGKQQSY